jgi:hypothetical protein
MGEGNGDRSCQIVIWRMLAGEGWRWDGIPGRPHPRDARLWKLFELRSIFVLKIRSLAASRGGSFQ